MTSTTATSISGIPIKNTRDLINPDTKICMMVWSYAKRGKTRFGSTMDALTKKHFGRPTLFIAMEPSDGGGTMSIQEAEVDYVTPATMEDFNKIVAYLSNDTKYGGVVVDSATEYVNRFLKPWALRFPYTKGSPSATRLAGVPEQGDYQTMGEQARSDFNRLINLTSHPDLKIRKHLLVTSLEREKTDRKTGEITRICPDLPGAMSEAATSMFQTVGTIELRTTVKPDPADPNKKIRVTDRILVTDASEENKKILGDRTKCIRTGMPLDFVKIWEDGFMPRFANAA